MRELRQPPCHAIGTPLAKEQRLQGQRPIETKGGTRVNATVNDWADAVRDSVPVVAEIHLRSRLVTEQRRVADAVRMERFEISTEGEADLNQR
jgi:hypothetical protein